MAGWSSNSKYAFLGALRSAAQMISYEVSMGFVIVTVLLVVGSLNLSDIVIAQEGGFWNWHVFDNALLLLPMAVVFLVSTLAETNRTPFDLPEAEAELVAGYFVEYSSFPFAMFFLGEYLNMMLMCGMTSILFFGGWHAPIPALDFIPGIFWFGIKIFFFMFVFFWVRATLPRYRYDQLMRLGWKVFLPLSLFWVVLVAGLVEYAGIS
jgi:NADH-quinone oxidoreductase subunit H